MVPLILDLVFKLVITPMLLLAATLAVRRWGEAIGGLLVGMPLTSGPISVFLALEHGSAFAAQATAGSLVATAAGCVNLLPKFIARKRSLEFRGPEAASRQCVLPTHFCRWR